MKIVLLVAVWLLAGFGEGPARGVMADPASLLRTPGCAR
jgi:hypothetical protein